MCYVARFSAAVVPWSWTTAEWLAWDLHFHGALTADLQWYTAPKACSACRHHHRGNSKWCTLLNDHNHGPANLAHALKARPLRQHMVKCKSMPVCSRPWDGIGMGDSDYTALVVIMMQMQAK